VTEVHCDYLPETKSGTPGAEAVKVKGTIHWVSAAQACAAEVRLYDRLFSRPHPGRDSGNYLHDLNSASKTVVKTFLEPSLREAMAGEVYQFERHGYFVADRDSKAIAPVFGRTVTLRDSWGGSK
jgi:glutaminyl-tRNA synthetase